MRNVIICLVTIGLCAGQTCVPAPSTNGGSDAVEELIYTNTNAGGVSNNPTAQTTFSINQGYTITNIRTYHWNGGQGTSSPGTISLLSSTGTNGPWSCTGAEGQGGVPNAYWDCYPNVELGAGTYTVVDSDNATWSHNSASGNAGIVWVYGKKSGSGGGDDRDVLALVKSKEEVSFNLWGVHAGMSPLPLSGDESAITVLNHYGSTTDPWGAEILAPITWNGNTFTVNHQNSRTTPEGSTWTTNIQIAGTLSADGRSISNWDALQETTSDQSLLGRNTERSYLVGSDLPIPYRYDQWTTNITYEVTGATVQNYFQTVEYYNEFFNEYYTGTDYNYATPPPHFFIMFSPRD